MVHRARFFSARISRACVPGTTSLMRHHQCPDATTHRSVDRGGPMSDSVHVKRLSSFSGVDAPASGTHRGRSIHRIARSISGHHHGRHGHHAHEQTRRPFHRQRVLRPAHGAPSQ